MPMSLVDVLEALEAVLSDFVKRPTGEPDSTGGERVRTAFFDAIGHEARLRHVRAIYDLSSFEIATVALALAPDLDVRFERTFALANRAVTRPRPTPGLALELFCHDAGERLACAPSLMECAPLFSRHVLEAWPVEGVSRLSSALRLDGQVLNYLVGSGALDVSLASWCDMHRPVEPSLATISDPGDLRALVSLAAGTERAGAQLVVYLRGPHGVGKLCLAKNVAGAIGKPVIAADLRGALRLADGFRGSLERLDREASLRNAVLFLHGYDALAEAGDGQHLRELEAVVSQFRGIAIVAGTVPWRTAGDPPLRVLPIVVGGSEPYADRRRAWSTALEGCGLDTLAAEVEWLASRFALVPAQITAAVNAACATREWDAASGRVDGDRPIDRAALASAARAQSGAALAPMARRITPHRHWDDVVLPEQSITALHEIASRVVHRRRVIDEWGFGARFSSSAGVTALFAGPSGTGKTLAAEIIASDLDLDLFRIDLARIVSKYIGETEKNLDRVFEAARDANGVLLFDEAEALFGKRTDVRDAHDRYANLEVAYLLQKMEEFDGLAILSTNQRQNMDEAFTRRLAFTVHFPFPEEADRRRIWRIVWPPATPRATDVAADELARDLVMSGGSIKNTALAAAFYAAADGGVVTRAHVLHAARREFQKMGKVAGAR